MLTFIITLFLFVGAKSQNCTDLKKSADCQPLRFNGQCISGDTGITASTDCKETCGYCYSGACIDTSTMCSSYLESFALDKTCGENSPYRSGCCATCQNATGLPVEVTKPDPSAPCTDSKGSDYCLPLTFDGKCISGNDTDNARKYCRKTCGYCKSEACIDRSDSCSDYLSTDGQDRTCERTASSNRGICCATCERAEKKCEDRYQGCSTGSESYVCHFRKSDCCRTCKTVKVDPECVDELPDCGIYGESYACHHSTYRFKCCATCKNVQLDHECYDRNSHCHRFGKSEACGQYANICCDRCRKLREGVNSSLILDPNCTDANTQHCNAYSKSYMCNYHRSICCATCKNETVDRKCHDRYFKCHLYDQEKACSDVYRCCDRCRKLGGDICQDQFPDFCQKYAIGSSSCMVYRNQCCASCKTY